MARALAFPGQGSQQVGMGKALHDAFPAAREVFQEVDDALELGLSRIVFDGPAETLTLTENAQPALMAVSLAVVRVLKAEAGLEPAAIGAFVAGHSLGEYSALAAAGSLPLADAARLLRRRGQAMQEAVPVGEGAMIAVLGPRTRKRAGDSRRSGARRGLRDRQRQRARPGRPFRRRRRRRARGGGRESARRPASRSPSRQRPLPLPPPQTRRRSHARGPRLRGPRPADPPLIANVTAAPVSDPNAIRRLLVEQVTATVRWRESVLEMKRHDVDVLVEIGAGRVLANLARRIDRDLSGLSLLEPREVEAFAASL